MRSRLRVAVLSAALLILLVLGIEGLLRLGGVDLYPRSSVLGYQEVYTPALLADTAPDGAEILRTWDPRHSWQSVPKTRDPRTLRVLSFGGSAAAGLGFSPNVTFARQLRDLLREGYPDRKVEVVNLGTVAIAAKQVRILVEDALEYAEPDAIVVWSGNNEFLAVHAEKYVGQERTLARTATDALQHSFLFHAVQRAVRGKPSPADLPQTSLATTDSERLTQARIIREISVSESERRAAVEAYGAELARIVRAAKEHSVPVLLCGVAVNEEWTGRHGLPDDWIAAVQGLGSSAAAPEGAPQEDSLDSVIETLDQTLARSDLSPLDRWEALIRRATAKDMKGDVEGANEDWRLSCEHDPHQRRATDGIRAAAAKAASEEGAGFLDGASLIQEDDPRGRMGFGHFYDYVHFTPRGAAVVATGIYGALRRLEGFPEPTASLVRQESSLPTVLASRLGRIAEAEQDFLPVDEFLGIAFDRGRLDSTDLWKYEAARKELDELLAEDPKNWRASAYRGNVRSYLTAPGAAAGALRDWQRALEHCDDAASKEALEANIERLTSRRITE